jgi:DnaJ family protein C protein 11
MVMETMERERDGPPDRQLYALLHLSPEASDDDVKKAYRQWAQVYHPDKHQTLQMQDIATQNFQKIREAYEILSDERKRQIYDLYGMEGLTSGLELGPKLKSREEVRAEFERLQQRQEERRLAAHVHHRGSLLMNLSLVPVLESYEAPRINGMAMSTQVQAQVSKRDTVVLGGNMALRRGLGGGSVTMVLRRQISPISSVEVLAMVGLRSILSLQTSRQLSTHSTGTLGLSLSLRDGSVTLANTWSRQLSEDTTGNIQLVIGPDTGISVGWQRHGKKNAGSADVKVGPATFGVSGQYIRHFSSKSQGRLTGKFGSTGVELELGGERRLSEHSSAAMFCVLGLQGVSWKVRFTRGGQKFVIPIVLCTTLNPFIATGALILPSSIYAILKTFVFKPYNLRRNRRKSLELRRSTYAQVVEARASSERSQLLLKNVAERKKQKQAQRRGLVILAAVYGDIKAYERGTNLVDKSASTEDDDVDLPPPYLDVAIPVQFLVDDFGQLRLHEGVKKAGLMGFCDPCPGESKQLKVSYSYLGNQYEVVVGDYDELRIPQEAHRIRRSTSEKLDQVD